MELRLIVGRSGSGKDFICEEKEWIKLPSYTTRDIRDGEIDGIDHIYVNNYNESNSIMAYTFFSGNHYWATKEQVCNEEYHAYIIDVKGIEYFLKKYKDLKIDRKLILYHIKSKWYRRIYRMSKRDGIVKAIKRFISDKKDFKNENKIISKAFNHDSISYMTIRYN